MAERLNKTKRSEIMSHNRGRNTSIEISVRKLLHKHGFRFRLHDKNLPGCPDIVLKKYNLCIFVNGCFWHHHPGCKRATTPQTNQRFWIDKFLKNAERDKEAKIALEDLGWNVLVIWECQIKQERTILNILSTMLPINRQDNN